MQPVQGHLIIRQKRCRQAPRLILWAKYVDLEKEIHEDIERFTELKHKIIGQIHMLDEPKYVNVLFMKYIEYKDLKEIAKELDYSYGRTKHIHGFALEAFRIKVLENSAPNSTI